MNGIFFSFFDSLLVENISSAFKFFSGRVDLKSYSRFRLELQLFSVRKILR